MEEQIILYDKCDTNLLLSSFILRCHMKLLYTVSQQLVNSLCLLPVQKKLFCIQNKTKNSREGKEHSRIKKQNNQLTNTNPKRNEKKKINEKNIPYIVISIKIQELRT